MAALGCTDMAITLPAGLNMDATGLQVRESEPTADVTKAGDTGNYSRNKSSGTLTQRVVVSGLVNGSVTGIATVNSAGGAAATFQMASGRTITGNYLVEDKEISGVRTGFYWTYTLTLVNAALVTATNF